jgi:hypothetical protein
LDISEKYSKEAQKIVRGFKNGLYFGNVDFHVGELKGFFEKRHIVADTTSTQVKNSTQKSTFTDEPEPSIQTDIPTISTPFLSHCILDMPASHEQIPNVTPHLHTNAKLILFVPSITQIVDAVEKVKELRLPLALDRVLELGGGISSGREWDVKAVKIRANEKRLKLDTEGDDVGREVEVKSKDWGIVCRPKVGVTVVGGGFLGVWTKIRVGGEDGQAVEQ